MIAGSLSRTTWSRQGARAVYLVLYATGVPFWRTMSFIVSVLAIFTLFWPLLGIALNVPVLLH